MTHFARNAALALAVASLTLLAAGCNQADKAKTEKTEKTDKAADAKSEGGLQIPGLPTEKDKDSYVIGLRMAKSLEPIKEDVDVDVIAKALKTALAGEKSLVDEKQATQIEEGFMQRMQAKQIAKMMADAKSNLAAGEKFLAENAKKPGVQTTASGLQYQVLSEGKGPKPQPTDVVRVHYKGSLLDGKTFDSSYDRGEPVTFPLPGVVPGWREGLALMPVGSKYRLWVPSALGYGERGTQGGPIGPNATLVFEVELLEIVKPDAK